MQSADAVLRDDPINHHDERARRPANLKTGTAECRDQEPRDHCAIETVLRRKPGGDRERHRQRQRHQPDRDSRDPVGQQSLAVIFPPASDRSGPRNRHAAKKNLATIPASPASIGTPAQTRNALSNSPTIPSPAAARFAAPVARDNHPFRFTNRYPNIPVAIKASAHFARLGYRIASTMAWVVSRSRTSRMRRIATFSITSKTPAANPQTPANIPSGDRKNIASATYRLT